MCRWKRSTIARRTRHCRRRDARPAVARRAAQGYGGVEWVVSGLTEALAAEGTR